MQLPCDVSAAVIPVKMGKLKKKKKKMGKLNVESMADRFPTDVRCL